MRFLAEQSVVAGKSKLEASVNRNVGTVSSIDFVLAVAAWEKETAAEEQGAA